MYLLAYYALGAYEVGARAVFNAIGDTAIMTENTHKLLHDYKGASALLSLSPAALRDLVYKGRGPVTVRIGRRTFFAHKDLEDFVEKQRQA